MSPQDKANGETNPDMSPLAGVNGLCRATHRRGEFEVWRNLGNSRAFYRQVVVDNGIELKDGTLLIRSQPVLSLVQSPPFG